MLPGFEDLSKHISSGRSEEKYDVDLRLTFYHISQKPSSFVRATAVCSTIFRRDLFLQFHNLYHIISAVTALHATTQLKVTCLLFVSCVMSIYSELSIDLSVSPRLLLASSATPLLYF